jgi:hypothetical protein
MMLNPRRLPTIVGENGHIPMSEGDTDWTVIVTREALEASASPPVADLDRLTQYLDVYTEIAGNKHAAGKDSDHRRIWVMEEDVAVWVAFETFRSNRRKWRDQAAQRRAVSRDLRHPV